MQIVGDSNSSDMTIFKREKYIQAKFDPGCCCSLHFVFFFFVQMKAMGNNLVGKI